MYDENIAEWPYLVTLWFEGERGETRQNVEFLLSRC